MPLLKPKTFDEAERWIESATRFNIAKRGRKNITAVSLNTCSFVKIEVCLLDPVGPQKSKMWEVTITTRKNRYITHVTSRILARAFWAAIKEVARDFRQFAEGLEEEYPQSHDKDVLETLS